MRRDDRWTLKAPLWVATAAVTVTVSVGGCGSSDDRGSGPETDAGMVAIDAASVPLGAPDACDEPVPIVGTIGTVSLDLDNSTVDTRPIDLGHWCDNRGRETWSPQVVVEYTVPGSGWMEVVFDTAVPGTDPSFDTLLQLRTEGGCRTVPVGEWMPGSTLFSFPRSCFDDASPEDMRSRGRVPARGGETIWAVVTGFSEGPYESEGPIQLEITATPVVPPTIEAVELLRGPTDAFVVGSGDDPEADAIGWIVELLGADGEPVDLRSWEDGYGRVDRDILLFSGFSGTSAFADTRWLPISFEWFDEAGGTTARIRAFDDHLAVSEPVTVPVTTVEAVGPEETCDPVRAPCTPPLVCDAGTCRETTAPLADCSVVTPLDLAPTADSAARVLGTHTFVGMDDETATACAPTSGLADIYRIDVPATGVFDLVARTDLPGTGDTDTVVYLRNECTDPGNEVACADDQDGVAQARLEVPAIAAGPYWLTVTTYGRFVPFDPVTYELEVVLRPVLGSGASCDPTGDDDRCEAGPCDPATSLCP